MGAGRICTVLLRDVSCPPPRACPPACLPPSLPACLPAAASSCPIPQVVGFVPTGWLYEMRRERFSVRSKGACSVHLVPYSEHSSYAELLEYVKWLRPHQVRVPAVRAAVLVC